MGGHTHNRSTTSGQDKHPPRQREVGLGKDFINPLNGEHRDNRTSKKEITQGVKSDEARSHFKKKAISKATDDADGTFSHALDDEGSPEGLSFIDQGIYSAVASAPDVRERDRPDEPRVANLKAAPANAQTKATLVKAKTKVVSAKAVKAKKR